MSMRRDLLVVSLLMSLVCWSVTPASAQGELVRVHAITPLTGPLAILGQDFKKGVDIAVEQINKSGGVAGRTFAVDITDTQGKPDIVRRELERIVRRENAPIILGGEISAGTSSAAQYAEQAQVPFLNAAAVFSELLERNYKHYFTQQITGDDEASAVLAFAKEIAGGKPLSETRLAILFEDSPRGAGTADRVRKRLATQNVPIAAEASYNRANRNLLPVVGKIAASKATLVVWMGYTEDVVAGLQALQQIEYYPYVLGVGGGPGDPRLPQLVNPALIEKLHVSNVDYFNADTERAAPLTNAFREKYGSNPSSYVSLGYAGATTVRYILQDILAKTPKPTKDDFLAALRQVDIPGDKTITPFTNIKFGPNGGNLGARALVAQWQDGGTRKATVWPKEIAKSSPAPLR